VVIVQDLAEKELNKRIEALYSLLEECTLCPRKCRVNRLKGKKGFCGMARKPMISSYSPHFGEEAELVGLCGSGTIFLTGCNLHCVYCQNYDISNLGVGDGIGVERFSDIMMELQNMGCHNINFVTPTHFTPQIIEAVALAKEKGLSRPLVYNCGGYEELDTLKLLSGIIDIYMPDAKYSSGAMAKRYSNAPDYPEVARKALKEMHAQVGDLVVNEHGVAVKGLLVRHLVLPNEMAGTKEWMHFITTEISKDTYVNIIDQYRPCFDAVNFPEIDREITRDEYFDAIKIARSEGLRRGF